MFTTSIIYYYKAKKADCLNGDDHKYELTHTHPKEWSTMRCEYCDDKKELTEKERIKFKIGTKESYFASINN